GRVIWCQGFSEPGSGSDLASLSTRAEDRGDHFVVNGQKIWTSYADSPADWMLLLVRTDVAAPKHRGISILLVDMTSPGVTVRPIESMSGFGEINEVFLDDVVVPRAHLLGEQDAGWSAIVFGLGFERTGIALHARALATLERLVEHVTTTEADGTRLSEVPWIRAAIAEVYVRCEAARLLSYRVTSMVEAGQEPAAEASMAWVHGALATQAAAAVGLEVLGPEGGLLEQQPDAPLDGFMEREWVEMIPVSIGAGTVDIQRLIVAQRGLGMPKAG
ncbi:MAG: acyl-CoA dehydrogenase family protein, partial [Aeromicrobium sp.]